jgi:hypothetical protein
MDARRDRALAEMLVRSGLMLGGDFAQADGSRSPYLLRLDLVASYPQVLDALAAALVARIGQGSYSRILCPSDPVPPMSCRCCAYSLRHPALKLTSQAESCFFKK